MGAMEEVASLENLNRAWRWIRSNADASYKSYFRELYAVYAIADVRQIEDLRDRLCRGIYEPRVATKLLVPKSSGIQRPISLLTVEDQVAYQAAVNVIAEKLLPRVQRRYNREVFGNLYAGKSSIWFYRKWSACYRTFNKAARAAFKSGFKYTASFDLTACYDSLDHGVLTHFLNAIGIDPVFCEEFTRWLSVWTAWPANIYHNHGIPQGPLSSGLLSEVVLQHFDANRGKEKSVRYFRYVDDIRLFAKSELALRHMIVTLDKLSKDVGLFPQSSKISIHEITDIDAELKSVSQPIESVLRTKVLDQTKLRRRLAELSPRFRIKNPTRFKYLLACAKPHHSITVRLWRIFERSPEYYGNVARYLEGYPTLPDAVASRVLTEIRDQRLYQAIACAFVRVAHGRLPPRAKRRAKALIGRIWRPATMQPDLIVAVGGCGIHEGVLSAPKIEWACTKLRPWWARAMLITHITENAILPKPVAEQILNRALRDPIDIVSAAAASKTDQLGTAVRKPTRTIHRAGTHLLKELGLVRHGPRAQCGIQASINRMVNVPGHPNWRAFFGKTYRKAERQAVNTRAFWDTNMTSWVNAMDVFDDWLLHALYRRDSSLGTFNLGSIGSVLSSPRLKTKYPAVHALAVAIHDKRYGSLLSHPVAKRTGKPTRSVKHSYSKTARRLIRAAVNELASRF